jgi:cobalt-zinc-cadmium efflux system membrane fusion protein
MNERFMNRSNYYKTIGAGLAMAVAMLAACYESGGEARPAKEEGDMEAAARKPTGGEKRCEEHGLPEPECGICHPEKAAKLKPGEGMKVRLPATDSAKLVGVETAASKMGTVSGGIDCYAEMAFNQNKLAQIAAPVGGIVRAVEVDLGDGVEENQCVARLWSAALAEAMAKAVLTHQTLERERKLRADRVTSERDLQQAEADHRAACQQARTLGFSEADIDRMAGKPDDPVYLEVRAPFAGEIIERTAVRGALVEAGKPLFTLADRSVMWAMLNIPEPALVRVKAGRSVELRVESLPGKVFAGKLTWISAEVDDKTRMARARAEVANPDGALKAKMFARARILVGGNEAAVVVPASAICALEGKPFVFVKLADDLYESRAVRTGVKFDGQLEVVEGLKAQEVVVVNHGFAIKSQWLSSRMGAGCAD